jgi:acyl-CoA reductase-like NAD-dependent aldehyde dehydrogenase
MNTADWASARPAFLAGNLKRMLINGTWVESASGKTFDSMNPSTGESLATVAEGDAEDINRAVARGEPSKAHGASSSPTSDNRCYSSSRI